MSSSFSGREEKRRGRGEKDKKKRVRSDLSEKNAGCALREVKGLNHQGEKRKALLEGKKRPLPPQRHKVNWIR